MPGQIEKTREALDAGLLNMRDRHTIFGEILTDKGMDSEEKGTHRLAMEAFAIMGAGTETTASTISVITYYLLQQPGTFARLTAELEKSGLTKNPQDLPSFHDLYACPSIIPSF